MTGRKAYEVVAKRWKRGWELHVAGAGVTQSRNLLDAEGMVRDHVAALTGAPRTRSTS
ncbi:hypothetical protein [Streptomyces xinghaiensis]|uniref:hypothetical protein n=1 Tax=Streptomyces xinghaiensis TaxID=1038928 RepID=UPI003439D39D